MATYKTDNTKRSTEHPIERPPDTDPQQGHEHPEAEPPAELASAPSPEAVFRLEPKRSANQFKKS